MHIALIEPEIPQNTGNISRTCVLTNSTLHLVKPLGFSVDDRSLKRAGLDYWPLLKVMVHESQEDFFRWVGEKGLNFYLATTHCDRTYTEVAFREDDMVIFGRESRGLDKDLLAAHPDRCIRIPMLDIGRSLNLSNSAAIIVYEGMRQLGFPGLV